MAEVQIPMSLGNRIIFVKNIKAKTVIPPRSDATSPADYAAVPPAPAATGSQSHSSCRWGRSPAILARRSEPESWQRLKPTHDPQQALHIYVAIDNNAPAVYAHNLDSATAQSSDLFRLLRHDHRR